MSARDNVERIVHEARERQGGRAAYDNCIENARVLKAMFEAEHPEWEVSISRGAVVEGEESAESYVQAKRDGAFHHWVVVHTNDGTFHCDLASEASSPPGDGPMIRRGSPPESYVDFGHRRDS